MNRRMSALFIIAIFWSILGLTLDNGVSTSHFPFPFPNAWNHTERVAIRTTLPKNVVVFDVIDSHTKKPVARVLFDRDLFVKGFPSDSYGDTCERMFEQKGHVSRPNEIHLGVIPNWNMPGAWTDPQFPFAILLTITTLIERREFCLEALSNKTLYDHMLVRDYGFVKGPLCGSGGKDYILPTGQVFFSNPWIA